MCSPGEEIWFHFTGMICPWAGNLTANFWKMSNPYPMPYLPPPPPPPCRLYINRCIGYVQVFFPCRFHFQFRLTDSWPANLSPKTFFHFSTSFFPSTFLLFLLYHHHHHISIVFPPPPPQYHHIF